MKLQSLFKWNFMCVSSFWHICVSRNQQVCNWDDGVCWHWQSKKDKVITDLSFEIYLTDWNRAFFSLFFLFQRHPAWRGQVRPHRRRPPGHGEGGQREEGHGAGLRPQSGNTRWDKDGDDTNKCWWKWEWRRSQCPDWCIQRMINGFTDSSV